MVIQFCFMFTGPFSKVTTKSGIHETTVGGVTLQVLNGDITTEKTDVIVNSSNKEFTLKSGKVTNTELVETCKCFTLLMSFQAFCL